VNSLQRSWSRLKRSIKEFHTKKPHIEFFTALLTIPVLLTVIILNLNNLKGTSAETKEPTKNETIVITQGGGNTEPREVIVTKEACEPGIGDISIASPEEGDTVSDNPVEVDVDYDAGDYCEVVWSYRLNGGTWSSYDDRSIALYNLPNGEIKLDLRVKSVVNSSQKTLSRTFNYTGAQNSPTTSPTPTAAAQ
jgi:hypothetical protein